MIIYIIGFMGSGKSSLGKKLARKLEYGFIDLDEEIEKQEGKSISDIFKLNGESHFRAVEARCLRDTIKAKNTVVACGGGTPCYESNIEFMNSTGYTIYLEMSPAALKSRLETSDKNKRPLLKNLSDSQLMKYIESKLEERKKWYDRAKMKTDGLDVNTDSLVANLLSRLSHPDGNP